MNILCSPSGLMDIERPGKGIANIAAAGFESILLDAAMCCPANSLELLGIHHKSSQKNMKHKDRVEVSEHPGELQSCMKPFLNQCRQECLRMPIARAPYLASNTKREDLGELLIRLTVESIRLCREADCQYLIVTPPFSGIKQEDEWEANRRYYLSLLDEAQKNNVTILLENHCWNRNGHLVRGICADADEAAAWIDKLNAESGEERFGFCMDAGACCLCGQDMREFAVTLGSRIKAVILRDCDGHYETSMLPFTCANRGRSATDWLGLIRGLREIDFDGQLILDFSTTAMSFSQLLHPQLLQFARSVAEFLRWQISMKNVLKKYDTRVLFGAGNMCRNFMKCYGDEFPPLFTCDNNKARWGEQFEGLEIKSPESLKELPPDCAIFICNIYYKEIEHQLREMGVSNPIEYFNDEYMPSYYFDRLEYWEATKQ